MKDERAYTFYKEALEYMTAEVNDGITGDELLKSMLRYLTNGMMDAEGLP